MELPELKSLSLLQKFQEKKTIRELIYQGFTFALWFFVLLNMVIIGGSLYILYRVNNENFSNITPEDDSSYAKMNDQKMQSVVNILEARKSKFDQAQKGGAGVFDPSL